MKKKVTAVLVAVVMVFSLVAFAGCGQKASKYTEAEHLQRVTERIEKRFMTREH
jgi:uncharacterized lipoprotein YehR (DUF1307 family)